MTSKIGLAKSITPLLLFSYLVTTCPNPKDLNTEEIVVDETSNTYAARLNFTENIWYLISIILQNLFFSY